MLAALKKLIRKSHVTKPVSNNRGMALMVAVSSVALMIWIATEVMYDTTVEYNVNAHELNRLKAYYAARGAVELGLLRIKIYQNVKTKLAGQNTQAMAPYIDQIWSFPFQWPFPAELLGTSVDAENSEEKAQESLMDTQYTLSISDEGSKIDLNDLVSPSKVLRENAEKMLKNIFEEKIINDDTFRRQYGTFKFDDLINSMKDWMSSTWTSQIGGDKRTYFGEYNTQELPPNRGFRTIGEMRLLPLMDDTLFEILQSRVTIYGLKGVNPNTATSAALQSLDIGITKAIADRIIEEREKAPFSDANSFFTFVTQEGARMQARSGQELPLTFETMTSFRVTAHGQFGNISRSITAIVVDINSTAARIKEFVDKEKTETQEPQPGTPPPGGQPAKKTTQTLSKGPPRIVYWFEQ